MQIQNIMNILMILYLEIDCVIQVFKALQKKVIGKSGKKVSATIGHCLKLLQMASLHEGRFGVASLG